MLALVYHGPDDVRLDDRPIPDIAPDEVLIRVVSAGICGTDLRIVRGQHRMFPPGTVRIPGHEVVGDVVRTGSAVSDIAMGQRVFVAPNIGCGSCRHCRSGQNNRCASYEALGVTMDGGFAEYMRIPGSAVRQGNLILVEDGLDPGIATLIEPLACVLRGQNASSLGIPDTVLIVGAGPIGLLHLALARLRGACSILVSDYLAERLQMAQQMGADRVVDPARENLTQVVRDVSRGEGADVIIVAAPSTEAQEEALLQAAIGGRINFFGGLPRSWSNIRMDSNIVHYKELTITGTTACSTEDCWEAAQIVNSGRIDLRPLLSARFPLRQANEALALAGERQSLKIVLDC